DWETASTIIEKEPDAVRAIVTGFEETALIVAVRSKKRNAFVEKLLEKMSLPDVALPEKAGSTALHIAALVGNIEAAEMLVGKDPKLPNVGDINKSLPIHRAALYGRREMVLYLFTVTKEDSEQKPFDGESGGTLLCALISSGLYDVALFLLQRYPKLAWEDPSPLDSIAAKPSAFPIYLRNEMQQTLMHLAILNRRENVYNLIYQFDCGDIFISPVDAMMNNGLHLTGKLETQQKLNLRASAAGAALQMQRELQWYILEVEKFTQPRDKERANSESMTPAMIFTKAHNELVKDGEQWMKDTANSCTIVAALIVTVVFASAITVPGGNNGDTGLPIFTHKPAFVVFAISDALALFSSTSSLLMFLSILTSRYGEEDFLYALPKRLIIGLLTLFLSIISMMIAFTATIYMLFEYKGRWILTPVAVLSGLPVTIFMWLQFPLLLDLMKSTYKPGIFGKQSDRILF
ncbi:hypothetical protein RJ640_006217, partial [Escallonia rubra]